jgi:CHAT domain-containing protein/tetratricopeptide (TPR) repeat protein
MAGLRIFFRLLLVASQALVLLRSEVRRVPQDYPTIKSAARACVDGDVVEVGDGFYFENNIVLDRDIELRAKTLFGAVIDGFSAETPRSAIFLVRAKVNISGFILKNCQNGIEQRHSPDVSWQAHDLAILNMKGTAVSVNDVEKNNGSAALRNIIVDNCHAAFSTNEARGMDVRTCLITNCGEAFCGSNHIYFRVDRMVVWNCDCVFMEVETDPPAPATNAITRGPDIVVLDSLLARDKEEGLDHTFWTGLFEDMGPQVKTRLNPRSIREGLALTLAGEIYCRLKNCRRAIEFFEAAIRVGHETGSEEVLWRACAGIALVLESQGKLAAALQNYKEAVLAVERIRGRLRLRFYNPGFFKDKMEVYVSLIRLLYAMQQKDPSPKYAEEAFAFAERARARGFLDSLEEAGLGLEASSSPDLRREEQRLSEDISYLQIHLQTPDLPGNERKTLLEKLDQAECSYRDLLIRMRQDSPKLAGLPYKKPLDAAAVRERLPAGDTALVEYVLGENSSFAFLVTKEAVSLARLPRSGELSGLVASYLRFLNLRETNTFLARRGGQRLCELLLGPFQSRLRAGIRKIIVVPDGKLYYLPFEALVEPATLELRQDQRDRFLVEAYEFSYAPSASALVRLLERRKTGSRKMDLLAVAAPTVPGSINLGAGLSSDLPALRYAQREIRTISRFFQGSQRKVLSGRQAEEGRLKNLALTDYRIIHFAAHGLFDDQNWDRSCLLLGRSESSNEDGLFQPRDILGLDLASDLVVLSACQTGKGRLERGEGLTGLASAFLLAGSESVLVSLWNINDRSTARFMEFFYSSLSEGKSTSLALGEAKVKMINSGNGHPFFWAAFVLVGGSAVLENHSIEKYPEAEASTALLSSRASTVHR